MAGPKNKAAVSLGRLGGLARAKRLSSDERAQASAHAARARWANKSPKEISAVMKKVAAAKKKQGKT
jgi:acyl-CoA reductase-like NAD-dependent aldehyde dehydrogenase